MAFNELEAIFYISFGEAGNIYHVRNAPGLTAGQLADDPDDYGVGNITTQGLLVRTWRGRRHSITSRSAVRRSAGQGRRAVPGARPHRLTLAGEAAPLGAGQGADSDGHVIHSVGSADSSRRKSDGV